MNGGWRLYGATMNFAEQASAVPSTSEVQQIARIRNRRFGGRGRRGRWLGDGYGTGYRMTYGYRIATYGHTSATESSTRPLRSMCMTND